MLDMATLKLQNEFFLCRKCITMTYQDFEEMAFTDLFISVLLKALEI
jgi:hypothetical protein